MPKKQSYKEIAEILANTSNNDTDPQAAALHAQQAVMAAVLAVADEITALRESVEGVQSALEDRDGFGVGIHLHYISDWLEKISKR